MKLMHFVVISIGIIMLFYLAGIETGTSQIINNFQLGQNNSITNPSTNPDAGTITSFDSIKNLIFGNFFWVMVGIAIIAIGAVSFFQVAGLSFSLQADYTAVYSVIASALWIWVSIDLWTIKGYIGSLTGSTGVFYYLSFFLIVIYMASFAFALFQFIKTGT